MCFEIISLQQKKQWIHYLSNAIDYDFYHTWHYHTLERCGEPILFVYHEEGTYIAIPFVKRLIDNSEYFDLTTTYGYLGPVSNKCPECLSEIFLNNFKDAFKQFMSMNKFISVFSRLNPFLEQKKILNNIAEPTSNGRTIYIDLSVSLEEQRAGYDKRLGRQIRQLRKAGFNIKETRSPGDIKAFTKMYNDNMLRLKADASYFYNEAYFADLLNNNEAGSRLIGIFDHGTMICGAIVLYSRHVIRNHLSATSASHINQSPSKLLTDEISILGRNLGLKFFHLGGGVGGKEDSLFSFKASFSPLTLQDNIWCYIADRVAYDQLAESSNQKSAYFPVYRTPK